MVALDAVPVSPTVEHRWRAMGSEVHLVVHAVHAESAALVSYAVARIAQLEGLWSRFRPASEISALNAASGRPLRCSRDTVRLVESLVRAWWLTNGAFDPTLLGSLIELGYDVSRDEPTQPIDLAPDCYTRGEPDAVLIDPDAGVVQLPAGTALDAGGLGKGLAADIVAAELIERGAIGALVSVGGDIAVLGRPDGGSSWCIEVQPHPGADAELVELITGGVATSSTRRRTWNVDGSHRHHLIDPTTGHPTTGSVTGTAVIAGSASTAEAFSKCGFVVGPQAAIETYDRLGLAGRVWVGDRRGMCSTRWMTFALDSHSHRSHRDASTDDWNEATR